MPSRFHDRQAKEQVASAVQAIEAQTAAEVVVAVRPVAGFYRHTDYLLGFCFSFLALLVFLFDSHDFNSDYMPLDSLAAFVLGTLLSAYCGPLRRLLTSRKLQRENVQKAARATFVDLGISKTSGRTGILVFVSMFERQVEVVADLGVDTCAMGPSWQQAERALTRALIGRSGLPQFIEALRALGPLLAARLPRSADDVNELPDEVA